MSTVAIIPARGGSKGIPDKNLQPVYGVPLVARAIRSALATRGIDRVFVSTDTERIASVAQSNGATVINRPPEISGDEASSESAVLHALESIPDADVVVFIQATSPFIDPKDLDEAITMMKSGRFDAVFSATEDHGFRWEERGGEFVPVGHEASSRPRRQDLPHRVIETGAFYLFRAQGIRTAGSRFHGRIGCVEVGRRESLEIDTQEDLQLARELAMSGESTTRVGPIDAVVFDFDGVHTDDHVFVTQDGVESVRVSRRDGYGITLLKKAEIPLLILSTEKNPVVTTRAKKLGVDVLQGQDDKATALTQWAKTHDIDLQRVAYLGNDVNDAPALGVVGWPVVTGDAHPDVKPLARLVLESHGGRGAVRELADLILKRR
ncbi:N-acetylneuraminate cytidylyltransferase [Pontimonas salivibrio]|uniref:N-acylneuraminate cytidylyltransferase n=1 Tax=Pontimonas salivibrio TaxID=1159327 RepID=A0A2L2BSE0_9MICO|nr:acylneuraminate cytidylyltransferase [Pontimonas salivibrio]AVG24560.1 N-acetylneuraminate cytidylyltransferase [Pontimonas salivibrio]